MKIIYNVPLKLFKIHGFSFKELLQIPVFKGNRVNQYRYRGKSTTLTTLGPRFRSKSLNLTGPRGERRSEVTSDLLGVSYSQVRVNHLDILPVHSHES